MIKRKGTSIIFVNSHSEILLVLRDNIPEIPCPNMWDLPGGAVEDNETPEQTIVREMKEEIGLDLKGFSLFSLTEFFDRTEYTYWKEIDLKIEDIELTEGQELRWLSQEDMREMELAFNFNTIIEDFFKKRPFSSR